MEEIKGKKFNKEKIKEGGLFNQLKKLGGKISDIFTKEAVDKNHLNKCYSAFNRYYGQLDK